MIGIVAGWGLALLPLGLAAPTAVSLAGFAIGGVIYAPYNSISIAVFQDRAPAGTLATLLAARSGLMIVAAPLGTALGGPLVAALGARVTLLVSALTTIALAVLAAAGRVIGRYECGRPVYSTSWPGCGSSGNGVAACGSAGMEPSRPAW
jgi:hypothetical protein